MEPWAAPAESHQSHGHFLGGVATCQSQDISFGGTQDICQGQLRIWCCHGCRERNLQNPYSWRVSALYGSSKPLPGGPSNRVLCPWTGIFHRGLQQPVNLWYRCQNTVFQPGYAESIVLPGKESCCCALNCLRRKIGTW